MSDVRHYQVEQDFDGRRLDRWFKEYVPELGRGRLEKLLRTGQIRVDGKRVKSSTRLASEQTIRVPPLGVAEAAGTKREISISKADRDFIRSLVIYEDEDLYVLNKPAGIAVQGGTKTVRHIDGLLEGLRTKKDGKPKLVHRLDRDTSGVLVVAKSAKSAAALSNAFQSKKAEKIYWALCVGVPRPARGLINAALVKGREGSESKERMHIEYPGATSNGGKEAQTRYAVVAQAGQRVSWLALKPVTGRTHQIRVHCSAMGHPIVADFKYGGKEAEAGGELGKGMHLHARLLRLPHPRGGILEVTAELPQHMEQSWQLFSFDQQDAEEVHEALCEFDG